MKNVTFLRENYFSQFLGYVWVKFGHIPFQHLVTLFSTG